MIQFALSIGLSLNVNALLKNIYIYVLYLYIPYISLYHFLFFPLYCSIPILFSNIFRQTSGPSKIIFTEKAHSLIYSTSVYWAPTVYMKEVSRMSSMNRKALKDSVLIIVLTILYSMFLFNDKALPISSVKRKNSKISAQSITTIQPKCSSVDVPSYRTIF